MNLTIKTSVCAEATSIEPGGRSESSPKPNASHRNERTLSADHLSSRMSTYYCELRLIQERAEDFGTLRSNLRFFQRLIQSGLTESAQASLVSFVALDILYDSYQ